LIEGGRQLLAAAACSVHSPQPSTHDSLPRRRPVLDSCRLGQTERGSFVATIITPVPPRLTSRLRSRMEESQESSEPFPRRVTTRLMKGLAHVSQSLETGVPEQLLAGVPTE